MSHPPTERFRGAGAGEGWLEPLSLVHEALARLCSREQKEAPKGLRGKKYDPQGASGRLT